MNFGNKSATKSRSYEKQCSYIIRSMSVYCFMVNEKLKEMKTPIEMLNAIIEMQEANYGNATNTHLDLITLAREAKDVVKTYSIPNIVEQSEDVVFKISSCPKVWCPFDNNEGIMCFIQPTND